MKWYVISLKTTVEAEDVVSALLMDHGICGVEIRDDLPMTDEDQGKMFGDIPLVKENISSEAEIVFYLDGSCHLTEETASISGMLEEARLSMPDLDMGSLKMTMEETEDQDWADRWKEFFHAFLIDDVAVVPSWEKDTASVMGNYTFYIDPGMAFGTGTHETTRSCVKRLRRHVKAGDRVLDVGCGSGILGLLALKFGASSVVGTDLDPLAISTSLVNQEGNGLSEADFSVIEGNVIEDRELEESLGKGSFDIVTANILAEILVPLTPVAERLLKQGGLYIVSGILEGKKEMVADAMEASGMELIGEEQDGEWLCLTAVKK